MLLLIADIENRTDDPVMGRLVELALSVGAESASFINVMNRRQAMRTAGLPPTGSFSLENAKQVALDMPWYAENYGKALDEYTKIISA